MKIGSMIFSASSICAILEGNKTMTRRVVKPQPDVDGLVLDMQRGAYVDTSARIYKPRYNIGDILWVRETWREWVGGYSYKADAQDTFQWRSSRYMPKKAARIFLRVTNVRVERLQDITINDIHREGVIGELCKSCLRLSGECNPQLDVDVFCAGEEQEIDDYACLWDTLNAKRKGGIYAWDKKPLVWVYTFEQIKKPEGWCE